MIKDTLIVFVESGLIAAAALIMGWTIQTPLTDSWESKSLDSYSQRIGEIAFLDRYIERNPKSWKACIARAEAYSLVYHCQQAVDDCNRAIALKSDEVTPYSLRARAYYYMDKNTEALADFNRVIDAGESTADNFAFRSLIHTRRHDLVHALADGNSAVQLDKRWARGNYALALAEYKLGDLDKALTAVKQACQLDPDGAMSDVLMAMVLNETGKSKPAEQILNHAIERDATCGAAYWQLGVINETEKKYTRAVELCTIALSLAYDGELRAAAYATRGLSQLGAGNLKEALADCNSAIKSDSNCKTAMQTRVLVLERMKMPNKAGESTKAIETLPK